MEGFDGSGEGRRGEENLCLCIYSYHSWRSMHGLISTNMFTCVRAVAPILFTTSVDMPLKAHFLWHR